MPAIWIDRGPLVAAVALSAVLVGCSGDGVGPILLGVHPAEGTVRGADEVTLSGAGFEEPLRVWFGGSESEVIDAGPEAIVVHTPPASAGTVDVTVQSGYGAVTTRTGGFEYLPLDLAFVLAAPHYLPALADVGASDAAAADFDGDGDLDVLVAAETGASRLLVNTGGGQFVDSRAGDAPGDAVMVLDGLEASTVAVVARDFDRDGDIDVYACNDGLEQDQLLSNLDGVRFGDASEGGLPLVEGTCTGAAAVDVDGDGWDELALVGSGSRSFVRVLLNRGSQDGWGFDLATVLEPMGDVEGEDVGSVFASEGAQGAFTLDVQTVHAGSGAGRLTYELAAAGASLGAVLSLPEVDDPVEGVHVVILGDGGGQTLRAVVTDSNATPFTLDLGAVDWTGWQTFVLDDPGTWVPGEEGAVFESPGASITLEVAATEAASGTLVLDDVVLQLSAGRRVLVEAFERPDHTLAWDHDFSSIEPVDVDLDGDPDLVLSSLLSDHDTPLRLLHNRWGGQANSGMDAALLVEVADSVLPDIRDPVARVRALDADLDGAPDLFVVTDGGQDRLLVNDGHGHFFDDTAAALPVDAADGRDAAVGDLDLDGRSDLVVANHEGVDRLFLSDAAGGFDDHTPALSLEARPTLRVLLFDVDLDGDTDVLEILGGGEPPALYVSTDAEPLP